MAFTFKSLVTFVRDVGEAVDQINERLEDFTGRLEYLEHMAGPDPEPEDGGDEGEEVPGPSPYGLAPQLDEDDEGDEDADDLSDLF